MRAQIDAHLRIVGVLLRRYGHRRARAAAVRSQRRRGLALQTTYGVGAILACHLLAEIGAARRFRRARQVVRAAGLDPVVDESADIKRRGKVSKQGSPHLRWALVQAAQPRPASPDRQL